MLRRRSWEVGSVIRTRGLTHIQILVRDLERSVRFYGAVFGMEEGSREGRIAFLHTPGAQDTIALLETSDEFVVRGGVDHFGFHLADKRDLDEAIMAAEAAGGRLLERGTRASGNPYAYVADPDGHKIEF
jgi:catechol 2,3-dioxygenase-like lactoylglutathione lyase family enzyme